MLLVCIACIVLYCPDTSDTNDTAQSVMARIRSHRILYRADRMVKNLHSRLCIACIVLYCPDTGDTDDTVYLNSLIQTVGANESTYPTGNGLLYNPFITFPYIDPNITLTTKPTTMITSIKYAYCIISNKYRL